MASADDAGVPVALPFVARCVFATDSVAAYQALLQQRKEQQMQHVGGAVHGADGLDEAIRSANGGAVRLGQRLRPTGYTVDITVVDLVPATAGLLTEESVLIVLQSPPVECSRDAGRARSEGQVEETGSDGDAAASQPPRCEVIMDESLGVSHAMGFVAEVTMGALQHLLLPPGALLRLGVEMPTVFCAATGPRGEDGRLEIRAAPDLFRNLRASYVLDCNNHEPEHWLMGAAEANMTSGCVSDTTSFSVPLWSLERVLSASGEPIVLAVGEGSAKPDVEQLPGKRQAAAPHATKVVLCPALPDVYMKAAFGDNYSALIESVVVAAAEVALDGCVVSEGAVICLPVNAHAQLHAWKSSAAAIEVHLGLLSSLLRTHHGVDTSLRGHYGPGHLLLRVLHVLAEDAPRPHGDSSPSFGMLICSTESAAARRWRRLISGQSGLTQIVLVGQQHDAFAPIDCSPLLPPGRPPLSRLSGWKKAAALLRVPLGHHLVDEPLSAPRASRMHVVVAQGTKENHVVECVFDAIAANGMHPLLVNLGGCDEDEAVRLLQQYCASGSPFAVVYRNCQKLSDRTPLLTLLGELRARHQTRSDPLAVPADGTGGSGPPLGCVVLVFETLDPVPPIFAALATSPQGVLRVGNPSESDRLAVLQHVFRSAEACSGLRTSLLLSLEAVAAWTTGLSLADVLAFATTTIQSALATQLPLGVSAVLSEEACEVALHAFQIAHGHSLVSTRMQPVRWSDVGGLDEVKREIHDTIQLPILHPELFGRGMKQRAGILLYGPPGCGKTLLAKAVATEMNMNFMSVKGPELINQYVGESEKNIRLLFQKARDNAPCIVFFDELDALAPARGAKGDAGGAMDRIVAQLLVEVDGIGQTVTEGGQAGQVFIIGATNRPDLLDSSLMRPGRFDRLCYLGIPSSKTEQLFAVKALTRKFSLGDDVDLEQVVEPLDLVYTGADFFALCSDAMMFAVDDVIQAAVTQCSHGPPGDDTESELDVEVKVFMQHFVRARQQLKPSVSAHDLARYERLREAFQSSRSATEGT